MKPLTKVLQARYKLGGLAHPKHHFEGVERAPCESTTLFNFTRRC